MDIMIKGYVGIYMLLLLTGIQAGILGLGMNIMNTRLFLQKVETELENSCCSDVVIEELMEIGEERGYVVNVRKREESGGWNTAYVNIFYFIRIPILQIDKWGRMNTSFSY